MEVCKNFNVISDRFKVDTPVRALVTAYVDRTFEISVKSPPASYFLKKAAGISKGSSNPGQDPAGTVTMRQLLEIARIKQCDAGMESLSLESIVKSLAVSPCYLSKALSSPV